MEAVVLAGGLGTRLREVVSDLPKSMAPVNGRPFLEYLLDYLTDAGIQRVILSVGFRANAILDHFSDRYRETEIVYARETEPLGTGGGIRNAFHLVKEDNALVFNGDSLFRVGLPALLGSHAATGAMVTMALRHMPDVRRYGTVEMDETGRITGFFEKGSHLGPGYINGGVYVLNRDFILDPMFPEKFSIEKDCFETMYREYPFYGFPDEGYFLDIGIPSDYQKAQHDFRNL